MKKGEITPKLGDKHIKLKRKKVKHGAHRAENEKNKS